MKKFLKIIVLMLLTVTLFAVVYVAIYFPPVMTGMDAKVMCSCVFVTGRSPESVIRKELQVFPGLDRADLRVNYEDSTVTASLAWTTSKAVYRKGLGCVLLAEASEEEVRNLRPRTVVVPRVNPDTIDWPGGNRIKDEKVDGVDYRKLNETLDNAFAEDPAKPINTHGVVVVYDGKLIGEKYADGFNYNSRLMGWSMTKSIVNAWIGILVKEGKLNVDDPAPIQEWQSDERRTITINHLLQASSGLRWSESYFIPSSDFHSMFIRSDDKFGYAKSLPLKHKPGTFFEYSSGSTNILSGIVRQTLGEKDYYRFPYERLFHKIGMHTAIIEADAAGTFVGSSYCYASARDWARFGLLYLNDGMWAGERILPEGWVAYSTTPAPAAPRREYGAQIWLNLGKTSDPEQQEYPGLPAEAFVFEGFEGNRVVIIPSLKLVIARLGVTHGGRLDLASLVQGVIAALPSKDARLAHD